MQRRPGSDADPGDVVLGRAGTKSHVGDRRCIVTGDSQPRAGLIRFVIGPDGAVVPDILERLPGRGMWIAASGDALETAAAKNPFSRAAKQKVTVPPDLRALVDDLLTQRVVSLISLARKSGSAICGFEKVRDRLVAGKAVMLLQAADGSEDQKRKLRPPSGQNAYVSCLNAAELGLAFGREYVIHAALAEAGLTESIRAEARRLAGVRNDND